jgi:hypothetical protein
MDDLNSHLEQHAVSGPNLDTKQAARAADHTDGVFGHFIYRLEPTPPIAGYLLKLMRRSPLKRIRVNKTLYCRHPSLLNLVAFILPIPILTTNRLY